MAYILMILPTLFTIIEGIGQPSQLLALPHLNYPAHITPTGFVPTGPHLKYVNEVTSFAHATAHTHTQNDHAPKQHHPPPEAPPEVPPQEPQNEVLVPEPTPQKISAEDLVEEEWREFKLAYNKVYSNAEIEQFRREIFIENRAKIARHNQEYSKGKANFVQRLNPFGDMLTHEFNRNLNGFNRTTPASRVEIPNATTFIPSANVIFPGTVDWRQVGAVSSVKNQQLCAACWAFAAAGALEAQNFRKNGKLISISVQNLIDCSRPYGNEGCEGGLMDPAFEYIRDNNGVDGESTYPYEAQEKNCRFRRENVVATTTGYVDIAEGDESGLEIAVATLGPITAAIDASRDSFQFYSDGVYFDPECGSKPEQMNHAVLIVGYGQEPNGQRYWLVKNSYGTEWGIGGYIKIAKEARNHCGIATQASYPLV